MEGHIRPYKDKKGNIHKNVWHVVVPIGKYPNGRTRYKWETFRGPKREADNYLAGKITEVSEPDYTQDTKITVKEFALNVWLPRLKKRKGKPIDENTEAWYKTMLETYVFDQIGAIQLGKLTSKQIQDTIDLVDGSLATVRGVYRTIRAFLNKAKLWKYIRKNPMDNVESIPIDDYDDDARKSLTADEINSFLKAAKENAKYPAHYVACLMALTTAMRLREICGLRWENADLDMGLIFVREQLRKPGNQTSFKRTKTIKSRRTIPMAKILKDAIAELKHHQDLDKEACGEYYEDYGLVLTIPGGRPLDPRNFTQRTVRKFYEKADVQYLKFHGLRHSTATMLKSLGVDTRVIADICGHADEKTADTTYIHTEKDIALKRKAIAKLDRKLTQKPKKIKK